MPSDLPNHLRQLVVKRAKSRCEYCLLPQAVSFHKHEPDHIIPRQHGGKTDEANLALACMRCNRYKGPNVGSFDPKNEEFVLFFNPRTQNWNEHFELLKNGKIRALTASGRVVVKILQLNDEDRCKERKRLIKIGFYRS